MKTLLLIDTHALVHRFFHALPPFTGPKGEPTNALYGMSGVLIKIIKDQKPDYIAAATDRPEKTFREEQFKEYKIQRPPAANELVAQLIRMPELFENFGVKVFSVAGYEADDIIGTLVEKFREEPDLKIVVLSGDLDILQLVQDDKVVAQMFKTGITETVIYNEEAVVAKYGLKPSQLPDYKGFIGDNSDNIPGVKGIGPKTIVPLLQEFITAEEVYNSLGIIPEKTFKKLEGHKEEAFFSKKLATIQRDVPLALASLEELKTQPLNVEKLADFFKSLGFESLVKRLS